MLYSIQRICSSDEVAYTQAVVAKADPWMQLQWRMEHVVQLQRTFSMAFWLRRVVKMVMVMDSSTMQMSRAPTNKYEFLHGIAPMTVLYIYLLTLHK